MSSFFEKKLPIILEQMVEMYKNLAPMTGKNPEKAEKLVENIVKTYSGLVDMNDKIAFTKMHCLYAGDEVGFLYLLRIERNKN
jgi:hypothetical protein